MTSLSSPTWAGLAGELHGDPAGGARAFVLLHGLTFDRRMWEPVRKVLAPAHPVLVLDLPGHGDSPWLESHRLEHVVEAIHAAVRVAGLDAPVVVGHSLAAGLAGIYGAVHPASAIVNVDSPVWLEPTAQLVRSLAPRMEAGGFGEVWPMFAASMQRELLPPGANALLRAGDEVDGALVLSYWEELLERPVQDVVASVEVHLARLRAARIPYVGVHGRPLDPREQAWLAARLPHAENVVWPVGHHFPQLAHPERFAALLTGLAAALPAGPR